MTELRRNTMLSWFISLAGIWLVFSPSIFGYLNTAAATNDIVVGALITILGVTSAVFGRVAASSIALLITIIGLWEIAAPFSLDYPELTTATTNAVILGIAIALLGLGKMFTLSSSYSQMGPRYTSEIRRKRNKETDEIN